MSARLHSSTGAAVLLILVACDGVNAQNSAVLESVTVWAQKREANLQDVPAAVTALSAEQLSVAGLNAIEDVAEHVPTLDMQESASATTTSLRIRRIGSLGNIPTFEPAVGLFVDGAFRSRSLLGTSNFVDVERIEVLRGPQNTLYGKNTSAGVVALYTRAPGEQFNGSAEVTSGWIDTEDSPPLSSVKFRLGGPLTPRVRASAAAVYSTHGSTMANALAAAPDSNDDDRLALRGQLSWSPSGAIDLRLSAGFAREQDEQGNSDVFLASGAPSATVAGALLQAGLAEPCGDNEPHNRRSCSVAVNTLDFDAVDVTLLGDYRLANGWSLASVTSWDRYDAVRSDEDVGQLAAPILLFNDSERGVSWQEELRLASPEGEVVSWLAGIFYYRHDYSRGVKGDQPMFGPNGAAAYHSIWPQFLRGMPLALSGQSGMHRSHVNTRYLSAFGDGVWKLTDRLTLSTGLRWQRERKEAGIYNSVTAPGASLISTTLTPSLSPSGEMVNGVISRVSDSITWSLSPQYRVSESLMTYLQFSHGTKSGGFNTGFGNAPLAQREFGDERVQHYEMGARGMLADSRIRLSWAAFYTEYHDYQDAAFVSAQFSVGNADRVVLKGAEVEGAALIWPGVTVDFAISAADLTYANNTTGACYPGRTPDGTAPRSCSLAGEHPINAPVWTTHVGLQYERPLDWGVMYARADWSWSEKYNTTFSADPRLVQDDYSDIALRIGAHAGPYEIVLWADNVLDEDVTYIDAVLNLFNDESYQSFMAMPRRYGATLRVRF